MLSNEKLNYLVLEDEENTYLYFTYDQFSSFEIEIKGTSAIPEFPSMELLIFLLAVVTVVNFVLKAKSFRHLKTLTS
jgi:hypothetical protein